MLSLSSEYWFLTVRPNKGNAANPASLGSRTLPENFNATIAAGAVSRAAAARAWTFGRHTHVTL